MSADTAPNFEKRSDESSVSNLIEYARHACLMHRMSFEGTDSRSVRVPAAAVEELVQGLTGMIPRRVQQIVPFAPGARRDGTFSGMIWRQLAQRCDVERYYLVPSGEENRRRAREVVEQDQRFSLRSKSVLVMGWNDPPQVPMNDLWLIDGRVVVRQEIGGTGVASWLVSGHAAEVEHAQLLLASLMHMHSAQTHPVKEIPAGPDLTDWMLESAQMLYTLAQMSCTNNRYIDADGCRWYHGSWQYLRLFNMVSSPSWHAEFYATQLAAEIQRGARKILISGAADYTTLAFVLHAAQDGSGAIPADLDVHVLDLCQTPLLACQWYAGRLGHRITLHKADVTSSDDLFGTGLEPDESFDLVIADAFLTRFAPDEAQRVVSSWFCLLRPGGRVLTTVRLHPRNDYRVHDLAEVETNDRYRVTDPTDDFELRLRERATGWRGMLSIDLDDLSQAGREYAKRMKSNDLGDLEEVAKIFEDQEFEIVNHTAERVHGELIGTEYLRVTASRR